MKKGLLFVISAPSGAGKTTVCREFMNLGLDLSYAVSTTTRFPREGEKDGVDYFFVSREKFHDMIKHGDFLEYANVYKEFYGTSKKTVTDILEKGIDVLVDIDTQGAAQIRKIMPDSIHIFVLPPSIDTLKQRLNSRGKDSEEVIAHRLSKAREEIKDSLLYSYVVVNDELDKAVECLKSIYFSEKLRVGNSRKTITDILEER